MEKMDADLTVKAPLVYKGPREIVKALEEGLPQTPELVRARQLKVPLAEACQNDRFLNEFYAWEDNAYYQSVFSAFRCVAIKRHGATRITLLS